MLTVFANAKVAEEARSLTMLGSRQAYTNLSVVVAMAQEIRQIRERGDKTLAACLSDEDVETCHKAATFLNAVINGASPEDTTPLENLCHTFKKIVTDYFDPKIKAIEETLQEMKRTHQPTMQKFDFLIGCARSDINDVRVLYESFYHDASKALSAPPCVDLKAYSSFREDFLEAAKEDSYAAIKAFIKKVGFPKDIQESTFEIAEKELELHRHIRIAHVLEKFTYDLENIIAPPTAQIIALPRRAMS